MPMEDKRNGEMEDHLTDEDDIFVNADDGLRLEAVDDENNANNAARERLQQQILSGEWDGVDFNIEELINDEDFPTNLIITGFSPDFFEDEELRQRFEGLFQLYGEDAAFHYFKSFKRVRVTYSSAASAIQARIKMHMSSLGDNVMKCYFGQAPLKKNDKAKEDGLLHPPTPDKQFLISPPPSPPVDWEPMPESHPTLNYDLISAIAKLSPGEAHQLHIPEKESHPSIVVHIAGDVEEEEDDGKPKMRISQTRRPVV